MVDYRLYYTSYVITHVRRRLVMKKQVKKVTGIVMAIAMTIAAVEAVGNTDVAKAAGLKLNKKNLNLKVGNKFKLKVVGKVKGKVKWSSSKKKVATVSAKGVVKAKSKGTAKIYAKFTSKKYAGKKLTCKVVVKVAKKVATPAPTEAVTPIPASPTVAPTATIAPTATVAPTEVPEPTDTPEYMQEGAFIYEKLDISWIDPEKPMIAFTFDDGPVGSEDTSNAMRIQKVLNEYGCHATFNYVTSKLNNESNKNEVLAAMEAGHEIANHTSQWNGLGDINFFPDGEAIANEIENSRASLEEVTGIKSFTLRPPNLSVSELVFDNCNVPLIDCSVDSKDWMQGTTKAQILDNVRGAKDGDIVLMHETNPDSAAAVEELVPEFIEKGYQIVSVVELFAAKDIPLFPGVHYRKAEYKEPRE